MIWPTMEVDLLVMSRTLEEEFTGSPASKVQQHISKGDHQIDQILKGMQDMRGRLNRLEAATHLKFQE